MHILKYLSENTNYDFNLLDRWNNTTMSELIQPEQKEQFKAMLDARK